MKQGLLAFLMSYRHDIVHAEVGKFNIRLMREDFNDSEKEEIGVRLTVRYGKRVIHKDRPHQEQTTIIFKKFEEDVIQQVVDWLHCQGKSVKKLDKTEDSWYDWVYIVNDDPIMDLVNLNTNYTYRIWS